MSDETQTIQSPKRKRRWFQLSLRTFLVLVLAFGVWLGIYVDRAKRQRQGIEDLADYSNCLVGYGFQVNSKFNPQSTKTNPYPDWLIRMVGIDFLATVQSVQLTSGFDKVEILQNFPSVRRVMLVNVPKIDIELLTPLRSLTHLVISGPTDFDPKNLSKLPRLQELTYFNFDSEKPLSDISFVASLKSLKVLGISAAPGTDLEPILKLTELKELLIVGVEIDAIKRISEKLPCVKVDGASNDGQFFFQTPTQIKSR